MSLRYLLVINMTVNTLSRLYRIMRAGFLLMLAYFLIRIVTADLIPMSWQVSYKDIQFVPAIGDKGPAVIIHRSIPLRFLPWFKVIPVHRYIEFHRYDKDKITNLCNWNTETVAEPAPNDAVEFDLDTYLGPECDLKDLPDGGPFVIQVTWEVSRFNNIKKYKNLEEGPFLIEKGVLKRVSWLQSSEDDLPVFALLQR